MKTASLENAKFLGLTVKNIKTFEGHDTMPGFNATVYINGKKAFHAYEPASGGCMEYRPCDGKSNYREVNDLIQELEDKLLTRPKYECHFGGKDHMFQDNLDIVIDALVSDWEWQKVITKNQGKGLLIQKESGFSTISFKAGSIHVMLKKYKHEEVINLLEKTVKRELAKGETILNLEYLKRIGVKP
jgi:hypothetical protein